MRNMSSNDFYIIRFSKVALSNSDISGLSFSGGPPLSSMCSHWALERDANVRRERQNTGKHRCDWLITPSVHKSTSVGQTDGTGLINYRVNNSLIWSTPFSGTSESKWTWNYSKWSVRETVLWALSLVKLKLHLCVCHHHYPCNVFFTIILIIAKNS